MNVHPTKHEVRFHQARLVHDFLVSALRKALQQAKVPVMDLNVEYKPLDINHASANDNEPKQFFSYIAEPEAVYGLKPEVPTEEKIADIFHSLPYSKPPEQIPSDTENSTNDWGKAITFLQNRWLLSEIDEGILFIDSHAAQRFLCEQRIVQAYESNKLSSQSLLFPHTHTLTESLLGQLLLQQENLMQIGITIDQLSANTIIVRTLPKLLTELDSYAFLLALSARLQQQNSLDIFETLKLSSQFIKPSPLNTLSLQQSFLCELSVYLPMPTKFCRKISYQEL
ncbi:MAG: hypothetical protein ACHP9Y_01835 [Gammaproteobacteria bacterium]